MPPLFELHAHLYGCLEPDDLRWLAARNEPRWDIFLNSYRGVYGTEPDIRGLFAENDEARARLESYYYYKSVETFAHFQCCFDLLIALSDTSPDEMREIYRRVLAREPAEFAEYRQMFAPGLPDAAFKKKVLGVALAAAAAEEENPGRVTRVAISLFRPDEHARNQYQLVREVMRESEIAAKYITGLDFCAQEEGHPPRLKKELFREILTDNEKNPREALAILYHVGESYIDKSVESAARWVVEAARLGAHRLGHAVALGVNPRIYARAVRNEIVSERRDQINFELLHLEELRAAGYAADPDALKSELDRLRNAEPHASVEIKYDENRLKNLRAFQDWAMGEIKKTGAVLESCPTSNLRIAGLGQAEHHPLPRFLEAELPVVIAADDPGILHTTLEREFETAAAWQGVTSAHVSRMKETAQHSRSEIMSGRE